MKVNRGSGTKVVKLLIPVAFALCLCGGALPAQTADGTTPSLDSHQVYGDEFRYFEAAVDAWRVWWPEVPIPEYRMTLQYHLTVAVVTFVPKIAGSGENGTRSEVLPGFSVGIERDTLRIVGQQYQ